MRLMILFLIAGAVLAQSNVVPCAAHSDGGCSPLTSGTAYNNWTICCTGLITPHAKPTDPVTTIDKLTPKEQADLKAAQDAEAKASAELRQVETAIKEARSEVQFGYMNDATVHCALVTVEIRPPFAVVTKTDTGQCR
jgi:hypothetical protein